MTFSLILIISTPGYFSFYLNLLLQEDGNCCHCKRIDLPGINIKNYIIISYILIMYINYFNSFAIFLLILFENISLPVYLLINI